MGKLAVQHYQMEKVVDSKEVKVIIENYLNSLDRNALTEDSIIKSYEIDNHSIKHNSMGGIEFKVYLNSDKKLRVMFGLEKNEDTGKIEYSGGGYSKEVKKMIEESQ